MGHDDLERALDSLYAAEPSEFVALRKQLAGELRAGGSKEGAKELLSARRPSTSAWAMNQMARQEPDLVEQLLTSGRDLIETQTRALTGDRDGMRDAIRAHQGAIDAAARAALAVLGSRANDGFRSEIVATLRAASTDEDVGHTLQLGRVVREAEVDTGFPDVGGLNIADLPPSQRAPRPEKKPKAKASQPSSKARPTLRAVPDEPADPEEDARAEAHRRALEAVEVAQADIAGAQDRVDALQHDLETARQDLKNARTRHKQAGAEARRTKPPINDGEPPEM